MSTSASSISLTNYKHFWREIINIARFAPSVHNIQPWEFTLNESGIVIHRHKERVVTDGDMTGRETWLSFGILTEYITQLVRIRGYDVNIRLEEDVIHCQLKKLGRAYTIKDADRHILARYTDRSIYTHTNVSKDFKQEVAEAARDMDGVKIEVITNKEILRLIAKLTYKGLSIAFSSPDFRKELGSLINTKDKDRGVGIPLNSLSIGRLEKKFEKIYIKTGFGTKILASAEYKRWLSASADIAIFTDGDTRRHWLKAGQAYGRVSLIITSYNLSQATSAAIVEAATFHEDIEEKLGTDMRLQSLIRIGRGSSKKVQIRLDTEELIKSY